MILQSINNVYAMLSIRLKVVLLWI